MGFINEFKKALNDEPKGDSYEIADAILSCPHCGNTRFWKRGAQLNTSVASLFNVDFLDKTAYAYICTQCGRIEWFEE